MNFSIKTDPSPKEASASEDADSKKGTTSSGSSRSMWSEKRKTFLRQSNMKLGR